MEIALYLVILLAVTAKIQHNAYLKIRQHDEFGLNRNLARISQMRQQYLVYDQFGKFNTFLVAFIVGYCIFIWIM